MITRAKEIKNGTKTGISEKREKTEGWKEVYVNGVGKRGRGESRERGGNVRMEKEIFCGAHGSP